MQKIVPQNSFEYPEAEHLVHIVDDPSLMKRKVAGVIRDSWGDIKPEKGRTLVHIIALSTFEKAGCNQNADAFEEEVCKKSHPGFMKTARLYRHHKKTEESKKDGDIVKTAMNEKMGRVELLLSAIDEKCADWLGDLDKGGQVNFSMGWKCTNGDICSLCGNRAHKRDEYCEHLNKTASAPYGLGKILSDGRKCFTFNREGFWNDISYVGKGADMTAMDLNKVASAYGLNEVVVGGAELAEKYCPSSTILEKKAALLHSFRDSILPKFISGSIRMSVSTSLIDNKTAQEIADKGFNATRNAYREAGRIMPFDVFLCSLSKVAGAHNRVKVAMDGAYENFDEIAKDLLCHRKTASSIINSDTYCSLPTANNNVLSDSAKHDIRSQREMKIDEDFFIPQKVAYEKTAATELSPFFVQQYLDYKATESAEYGKNENELFDTFLLN